jgi:MFS family permease
MLTVWLPVLVDQVLDGGPGMFGALLAALAIGEVVAAILSGVLRPSRPLGALICAAQALSGASLLLVLATQTTWGAAFGLLLYGSFGAPLTVWAQTLRMQIIPARIRGRTFALLRMLMQGGTPVGGAAGGLLLPALGIPALIGLSALVISGAGAAGFRVERLRDAGAPETAFASHPVGPA